MKTRLLFVVLVLFVAAPLGCCAAELVITREVSVRAPDGTTLKLPVGSKYSSPELRGDYYLIMYQGQPLLVPIGFAAVTAAAPSPSPTATAKPWLSYFRSSTPSPSSAPIADAPATVAPKNNDILFDAYPDSDARGEFTVINGASRAAVAKLIDLGSDSKVLSFVITAHQRAKIYGIPDGSYRVIFAFGDRLYAGTDRFEKPNGFSKFDRPFTFSTTNTSTDADDATYYQTRYTTLEVTLTPVPGGNITTSSVSQKEFDRY